MKRVNIGVWTYLSGHTCLDIPVWTYLSEHGRLFFFWTIFYFAPSPPLFFMSPRFTLCCYLARYYIKMDLPASPPPSQLRGCFLRPIPPTPPPGACAIFVINVLICNGWWWIVCKNCLGGVFFVCFGETLISLTYYFAAFKCNFDVQMFRFPLILFSWTGSTTFGLHSSGQSDQIWAHQTLLFDLQPPETDHRPPTTDIRLWFLWLYVWMRRIQILWIQNVQQLKLNRTNTWFWFCLT